MATDEQKNYWEQNPDEQPINGEQPFNNGAHQTLETPDQSVAESYEAPVVEDTPSNPPITWSAQEYIHIDKGAGWFILFALVVLVLVAIDVFFLKSWTFSVLVVVMAIAIIIYVRRPPRTLTYALSPAQGLYVGERLYHFDEFRAFGLIKDGDNHSIMLIPRKRFAPGVSVFFPEEAGERIVDILGQRLPVEELKLDIVDVVIRKLRL
jgi:ABC-type multidrug transport system fused ATPase/permease subunit